MAYREILFRGKLSKKQTLNKLPEYAAFAPHGWVTGYYCAECPDSMFGNVKHFPHIITTGDPNKITTGMWWAVEEDTVGQYIGIDDANGKKIFEGDIVKLTPLFRRGDTVLAIVKYAAPQYRARNGNCEFAFDSTCEVVGNIYDNPELVGQGG